MIINYNINNINNIKNKISKIVKMSNVDNFLNLRNELNSLIIKFKDFVEFTIINYIKENDITLYINNSKKSKIDELTQFELTLKKDYFDINEKSNYNFIELLINEEDIDKFEDYDLKFVIHGKNMLGYNVTKFKKHNLDSYNKINEYYKNHILKFELFEKVKIKKQQIIEIAIKIKEFYENDKNKILTQLYKNYFNNLDKYINGDNYFDNKFFELIESGIIEFFISKHNIQIENCNTKLYYLQWYFMNTLYLFEDYDVKDMLENYFLKFSNDKIVFIIEKKRSCCEEYFSFQIINTITNNQIHKIIDKTIYTDKCFKNLFEFMTDNINKIYFC